MPSLERGEGILPSECVSCPHCRCLCKDLSPSNYSLEMPPSPALQCVNILPGTNCPCWCILDKLLAMYDFAKKQSQSIPLLSQTDLGINLKICSLKFSFLSDGRSVLPSRQRDLIKTFTGAQRQELLPEVVEPKHPK